MGGTDGGNGLLAFTLINGDTIPASVTVIGNYAFYGWTASQTIYVEGYTSQLAADIAWGHELAV